MPSIVTLHHAHDEVAAEIHSRICPFFWLAVNFSALRQPAVAVEEQEIGRILAERFFPGNSSLQHDVTLRRSASGA